MRISLSPLSGSPASEGVDDAVDVLRAELEACSHPTKKAFLHYELALLYEQVRDDHSAAKELLLAVNGDSTLREPLEHLIALMERRRSYANLGKLLDRLGRVAQSPEEGLRAQLSRGDYLVDHRADLAGALAAYEQAAQLSPENSPETSLVWLSMHYLGARQSDAKLVETALTRRIQLAHHKGYRDSLRLQLARFQTMRGRQDLARATLEAATSPHSPVLYPALLQLEQLAVKAEEHATRASLLEQQAEVLSRGLDNPEHAKDRGVPPSHLSVSRLVDVSVRAVVNLEAAGLKGSRVVDALARAFRFAPHDRLLVRLLTRVSAEASLVPAEQLLELVSALDTETPEALDASLWLGQAFDAENRGDHTRLAEYLAKALKHAPKSVVARALQLETQWAHQNFAQLAVTYEQLASDLDDQSSQLHALQIAAAAHVFAASSESNGRARAALELATARAGKNLESWHLALAHLANDPQWAHESLRRQVQRGNGKATAARLYAVRQAVLDQDQNALEAHVDALLLDPDAAVVGLLLRAALPLLKADVHVRLDALHTLSTLTDGDTRVGLQRFVAAQKRQHGQLGTALADLHALHEAAPSDPNTTRELVSLLLAADDAEAAVKALGETAVAHPDEDTQQEFHLHAGIVAYRANAFETAKRAFTQASQGPSRVGVEPLRWALRQAFPNDPATRRQVLELPAQTDQERSLQALERFALEVGFGNQKSAATSALLLVDEVSSDEVGEALSLARALWQEYPQYEGAVQRLSSQSSLGKELVAATQFYQRRRDLAASGDTLLPAAEEWASGGSLPAILEWLAVAVNAGQADAEVRARRALALALEPPIRDYLSAEAMLVEHFAGLSALPLNAETAAAKLANAELSLPMAAPSTRASALAGLVDVFEQPEASEHVQTLRLMAAYNHLAAGEFASARAAFEAVTLDEPTDLTAWEGLLECALGQGALEDEAKASMQIGLLHGDTQRAVTALRNAATLYLDKLDSPEPGYRCLARAVELDVSDTQAFSRLLKHKKTENAHAHVIALTSARLSVAETAKELTRLHWERARAYRALGNLDQALADLGNVGLLDPSHVGAKALAGDIYISRQDYRNAATELSELALLPTAPSEQRRLGAITAIDLFESKLNDIDAALELFNNITEANLDLLPVAERLLTACVNTKRWEETLILSSYLSTNLPTAHGRAEAARLQLAIHRDELHQPERAFGSIEVLLTESPGDPEGLDTLLDGQYDADKRRELLRARLPSILDYTSRATDIDNLSRLARIADEVDDLELRLVSLGALVAHGEPEVDALREIDQLLGHTAVVPDSGAPPVDLSLLVHDAEHGPLQEMLQLLAPHLPEVFGPTISSLGLGRKERRALQESNHARQLVSGYTRVFGLRDFEGFLNAQGAVTISAVAASKKPALIIGGPDRVFTAFERGRLAACIVGLMRGTYACLEYPPDKVAALLAAACKIGNVDLPGPAASDTAELERQLARELPRKVRKELEALAQRAKASESSALECVRAATATLDRAALLASGDLSQTLVPRDDLQGGLQELSPELAERFQSLTQFCLSTTYLNLRKQLGLGAK